jgi:hypothetical protein
MNGRAYPDLLRSSKLKTREKWEREELISAGSFSQSSIEQSLIKEKDRGTG